MPKKVVVIDDEESVCVLLERVLGQEGLTVKSETESEKALELIKKEKPDCILMDIKMPNINGLELLSKIKEQDKNVKIIMITGYGDLENAMESMKLGACDYITKPFDLEFVKNLVKECVKSSV